MSKVRRSNRGLTRAQIARLLRPVPSDRIEQKRGLSYLPQHEARAELIRIFGPGNVDHTMHKPELLYETLLEKGHPQFPKTGTASSYWVTGYLCGCTLRVRDYEGNPIYECTEYHFEENAPLPNRGEAHAMAVTSAESYALRRAAISLGDALGLHLYEKGSPAPFVKGTLMIANDPDSPLAQRPSNASKGSSDPTTPTPLPDAAIGGTEGQPEGAPPDEMKDRLQSALKAPVREVSEG